MMQSAAGLQEITHIEKQCGGQIYTHTIAMCYLIEPVSDITPTKKTDYKSFCSWTYSRLEQENPPTITYDLLTMNTC